MRSSKTEVKFFMSKSFAKIQIKFLISASADTLFSSNWAISLADNDLKLVC